MSMCYLCDLCAHSHDDGVFRLTTKCTALFSVHRNKLPINFGEQDPHEICGHFERKGGGDD